MKNHSLVADEIERYCEQFTTPESTVLAALNRETQIKTQLPVMLSGHLQGAYLQMVSCMIQPQFVLEIGTFTGYSAICLAKGLRQNGMLYTIDVNEEMEDLCNKHFIAAGYQNKIKALIGDAAALIASLDVVFDLVFIDADKQNYARYYDMVFDKVKPGGFILVDNVLYQGEVVLDDKEQSKNARAMHAFNKKIKCDERVTHFLLPLRDGIMMLQKKPNANN
jgi:caffeoyl-CoA O-methyltransferase